MGIISSFYIDYSGVLCCSVQNENQIIIQFMAFYANNKNKAY